MGVYPDVALFYIYGGNAVYATARSTSYGKQAAAPSVGVGQYYDVAATPLDYGVQRTFLKFNVPKLPIASLRLGMYITTDSSATDFTVEVRKYNWNGLDPDNAGNRETMYDGAIAATAETNNFGSTSGKSTSTWYYTGALDVTWPATIWNAGSTNNITYVVTSSRDASSTTPAGYEYVAAKYVLEVQFKGNCGNHIGYYMG